MTSLQRRIWIDSAMVGTIVAVLVVLIDAAGLLQQLEWWLYDRRAATCQHFMPPPSQQIVHLDIDDPALEAIGPWPWRRSVFAAILDEVRLAGPKAVGVDVIFSEPQAPTIRLEPGGMYHSIDEDGALADSLAKLHSAVMAVSFMFMTPAISGSKLYQAGVAEMEKNLRLAPGDLANRLASQGFSAREATAQVNVDYVDMLRDATRNVVRKYILRKSATLAEITRDLAPATASPVAAQPNNDAAVLRLASLVASTYRQTMAELAIREFSWPAPDKLRAPPPDAEINLAPLPQFGRAAAGCGFADYDIFSEPVVRAVPLFVRNGERLYPQLALAMACRMLDANLAQASLDDSYLVIPSPSGQIRIPVRSRYSSAVGRQIGSLIDIPWFGTSDWRTMYDWPNHREIVRHYSINLAWDIVDARQKIARNNATIDGALIKTLMGTSRANDYAAHLPDTQDAEARRRIAEPILQDLHDSGADDFYASTPDSDLKPSEREQRDEMAAIRARLRENSDLEKLVQRKRKELSAAIGNKGVLIGWVATGTYDVVPTSLHARCPGVVVHGVIANAILNRTFLRTAPPIYTALLTLMLGLLTTALTSRLSPARAVPVLVLLGGAYFLANGLFFYDRLHIIVNAAAPMVAIGACWSACMVVRLILEGLERIRQEKQAAVIQHEISLARQVQQALIPKQLTILSSIESHGWTLAATTTGGDCFDLWKLADGRLGILVADASGHGLGPSILVTEVRALVRGLCDLYETPQKLLERVNQRLASDLDGSKFVTTFVGFLSEDGRLSWGSAGHGPMLWCETRDGEPHELEATGLPLGVSEDWFGEETVPEFQLEPGGWLMVVTDGIFEAPSPGGEQFEIGRVKQTLKDFPGTTCAQIVEKLRAAVHKWQAKDEPADDQTIVVVRRCPVAAALLPVQTVSITAGIQPQAAK